ncbi:MAG: methyltransferase domain-containing protein [Anaerolineae bacterium]|nr:methyltransferase domain-containing protein [Anaerolineae bacterium]
MTWLIFVALAVAIAVALWYLLVKTEGVYLGRGAVVWLYDLYAGRYDGIKQYDAADEDVYLAQPILERLDFARAPLVLDVATGTGRLPLALLEQPTFQGRIIALDLSRKMLARAAAKLAPFGDRVALLHHPAEALPFPDGAFDLVTCLETLEFLMDARAVLGELVRVLRPGGLLVLTNRQGLDARLMPGHTFAHEAFERLLGDDLGLTQVEVLPWQFDYRIVYARKPGNAAPVGARPLEEVWQCPACAALDLLPVSGGWRCLACETLVPRGADGVIEVAGVRRGRASQRCDPHGSPLS